MQEMNSTVPTTWLKESNISFYVSIIFALFVALSIAVFSYLIHVSNQNVSLIQSDIQNIEQQIQSTSNDSQIIVAKILTENSIRPSIDLKNIIKNFRTVAAVENVWFDGFAIKDDVITTSLTSIAGTSVHPDPVSTIIKMMNDFSLGKQVFVLKDIRSISGDNKKRSTTIEFVVQSNNQ